MKKTLIFLLTAFSFQAQAITAKEVAFRFLGHYKVSSTECTINGAHNAQIQPFAPITIGRIEQTGIKVHLYGKADTIIMMYDSSSTVELPQQSGMKASTIKVTAESYSLTNELTYHHKNGFKEVGPRLVLTSSPSGQRIRYKEFDSKGKQTEECVLYRTK